jgi:hypothetical protein
MACKKICNITFGGSYCSYKGKQLHFEISVKFRIFRIGRHENKKKHLFYFGFRILLPIQIQLLEIENLKKSTPPKEEASK